jgi:hypothetical protein
VHHLPDRLETKERTLFAGRDVGAAKWAIMALLIETCKESGVVPDALLASTLTGIV